MKIFFANKIMYRMKIFLTNKNMPFIEWKYFLRIKICHLSNENIFIKFCYFSATIHSSLSPHFDWSSANLTSFRRMKILKIRLSAIPLILLCTSRDVFWPSTHHRSYSLLFIAMIYVQITCVFLQVMETLFQYPRLDVSSVSFMDSWEYHCLMSLPPVWLLLS